MVAEGFVLVALFHIALFLRFGQALGGVRGGLAVTLGKPCGKIQTLAGTEHGLDTAQNIESDAAIRLLGALGLHKVDGGIADEIRYKEVLRVVVDGEGRLVLLQHAVIDEADLGGEGHGFHLVVGDIDKGGAGFDMQALQLVAHFQAQLGIQVGERLIHEQDGGLRRQGAGDGDALLLAAGKLGGVAVHKHANLDDAGHTAHGQVNFLFGELAHLGNRLAVLIDGIIGIVAAAGGLQCFTGGFRLFSQGGGFGTDIFAIFQVVAQ